MFVTLVQSLPSSEISKMMLEIVPLPVEEKDTVYRPLTVSPSLGPLVKLRIRSLALALEVCESCKIAGLFCPKAMMSVTRIATTIRLIASPTSYVTLQCSHSNTPYGVCW